MTPIVLTENGEGETGSTTTPSAVAASARNVVEVSNGSTGLDDGSDDGNGRRPADPPSVAADGEEAKVPSAGKVGGTTVPSAHANEPSARREAIGGEGISSSAVGEKREAPLHLTSQIGSAKVAATAGGASLPLPVSTFTSANKPIEKMSIPPVEQTAASESTSLGAGATMAPESGEGAPRTVVKPEEQLFMEDTQVYLGCAVCGVKYLVEAVDPGGLSNSAQGDCCDEHSGLPCVFFAFHTLRCHSQQAFGAGGWRRI